MDQPFKLRVSRDRTRKPCRFKASIRASLARWLGSGTVGTPTGAAAHRDGLPKSWAEQAPAAIPKIGRNTGSLGSETP